MEYDKEHDVLQCGESAADVCYQIKMQTISSATGQETQVPTHTLSDSIIWCHTFNLVYLLYKGRTSSVNQFIHTAK